MESQVQLFSPSIAIYVTTPRNSLQYKCAALLVAMMTAPKKEKGEEEKEDEPKAKKSKPSSSRSRRAVNPIPLPYSTASLNSTPPYHYSSTNPMTGPIQLILNIIKQEEIPIRAETLCALLASAGWNSLDLERMFEINECAALYEFTDGEKQEILDTLVKNCDHVIRFYFPDDLDALSIFRDNKLVNLVDLKVYNINTATELMTITSACPNLVQLELGLLCIEDSCNVASTFKNIRLLSLKTLKCSITLPGDLITIFFICPNLTKLELSWVGMNTEDFRVIHEELIKSPLCQLRHFLYELSLDSEYANSCATIILILLFKNLRRLDCAGIEELLANIERIQDSEYFLEDDEDKYLFSVNDTNNIRHLFKFLKGLTIRNINMVDGPEALHSISNFCSNLNELCLEFKENPEVGDLDAIGNLRLLKELAIKFDNSNNDLEIMLPVLRQIGSNLTSLALTQFGDIDIPVIAICCPNLEKLLIDGSLGIYNILPENLIEFISEEDKENLKKPFLRLKTLRILNNYHKSKKEYYITYILQAAYNIEFIEITEAKITSSELSDLIKLNPMANLRILIIHSTNVYKYVSKTFIERFTSSMDKITVVSLCQLKAAMTREPAIAPNPPTPPTP